MTIAAPDANSTSAASSGDRAVGHADVQLEPVAVERQRRVDEVDRASPSQSRTLLATHATEASRCSTATAAVSHAGSGRASLLRNATYWPVALRRAEVAPAREPGVHVEARARVTSGAAARISASALPSPEALSTTMISSVRRPVEIAAGPRGTRWCRRRRDS